MKRIAQFTSVAVIAFCAGIALDQGLHREGHAKNQDRSELLQQSLRCKSEADEYAKNESQERITLALDKVEVSPSRHSCIGSFTRITSGRTVELWSYETIDILTGETLYSETCVESDEHSKDFCGNGRDMQLRADRDKAFTDAVKP